MRQTTLATTPSRKPRRREMNRLVENAGVASLVLLDDRDQQSDQLVPELETLNAVRAVIDSWLRPLRRRRCGRRLLLGLELALVQLDAVVEEELVGGTRARLDAVLDDGAGPRRTRQLLHLQSRHPGDLINQSINLFVS